MRVTPCIKLTIVPPTEPRQWYRGLGRTTRDLSGGWRWKQEAGSIVGPLEASSSSQRGSPASPPPPRRWHGAREALAGPAPPHLLVQSQALSYHVGVVDNVVVGECGPLGAAGCPLTRQAGDGLASFIPSPSHPGPVHEEHWTGSQETETAAPDPFIHSVRIHKDLPHA